MRVLTGVVEKKWKGNVKIVMPFFEKCNTYQESDSESIDFQESFGKNISSGKCDTEDALKTRD